MVGTLVCAAPIWIASSRIKTWQALLGGFLVFGALMAAGLLLTMWWAWRSRPTFRGMTPEQAAKKWVDANEATWKPWIEGLN